MDRKNCDRRQIAEPVREIPRSRRGVTGHLSWRKTESLLRRLRHRFSASTCAAARCSVTRTVSTGAPPRPAPLCGPVPSRTALLAVDVPRFFQKPPSGGDLRMSIRQVD